MSLNESTYKDVNYCLRCGSKLHLANDREGKLRPHCDNCGWIYYKNAVPAVAMVILNEAEEVLLIKRKFEPMANEWALPSGYMEIDLSPEENAIEEMLEETGLICEVDHFIDWHYGHSPIYERILNLGFRMKVTCGILQAGDDASEAEYFPLEKLPHIAFRSHRHFISKETGRYIHK